jgi:hypothetical protein
MNTSSVRGGASQSPWFVDATGQAPEPEAVSHHIRLRADQHGQRAAATRTRSARALCRRLPRRPERMHREAGGPRYPGRGPRLALNLAGDFMTPSCHDHLACIVRLPRGHESVTLSPGSRREKRRDERPAAGVSGTDRTLCRSHGAAVCDGRRRYPIRPEGCRWT